MTAPYALLLYARLNWFYIVSARLNWFYIVTYSVLLGNWFYIFSAGLTRELSTEQKVAVMGYRLAGYHILGTTSSSRQSCLDSELTGCPRVGMLLLAEG